MSEVVLALIVAIAFGGGFLISHFLTKQNLELEEIEREIEFKKELAASLKKNLTLEKAYAELSSKVANLSSSSSADEFNKLYEEIHTVLSNSGANKT